MKPKTVSGGPCNSDPPSHEAHYNLGNILRDQERLSEAEDSYRRALEIKPDLANALLNLGVTLTELGRHRESPAACRQALAVNPNRPAGAQQSAFLPEPQRKNRRRYAACRTPSVRRTV
ncbi:MAG: tetratricopeptide repeat protein [Candidatus Accumulibacter sp.]|uniref:tetratricopeptide repeat protein n=1 Tax=Accumulibacter sp. TaxID=2053492 RepID=UPI002A630240|nr:tetratricopeptide repeat protein [Accumulibacter sp.]